MSSGSSENQFKRSFDEVSGIYLAELREKRPQAVSDEDSAGEHSDEDAVIYRDERTEKLCKLAESVARKPTTVLLCGETGVGKEVFARFIHRRSKRAEGPLIGVNCAALSASLLESELFGHEKGAFSGAVRQHIGVFEQADGGTLLLDEISEMPLELQAKLLRVIQERKVVRVGGSTPIDVDIRIIATTNRDLEQYVADGHFRQDLFFRINVFPLEIPPLRQRPADIEPLASYYAQRLSGMFESPIEGFTSAALEKLQSYTYPGNIRELINIIERALIMAGDEPLIDADHLVFSEGKLNAEPRGDDEDKPPAGLDEDTDVDEAAHMVQFRAGEDQLTDVRRVMIERTLKRYDGHRSRTAQKLGVSTRTIRNKLKEYEERDS